MHPIKRIMLDWQTSTPKMMSEESEASSVAAYNEGPYCMYIRGKQHMWNVDNERREEEPNNGVDGSSVLTTIIDKRLPQILRALKPSGKYTSLKI